MLFGFGVKCKEELFVNKLRLAVTEVAKRVCKRAGQTENPFVFDTLMQCLVASCCAAELRSSCYMLFGVESSDVPGSRLRRDLAKTGLAFESDSRLFLTAEDLEALTLGLMPYELSYSLGYIVVHQLSNQPCGVTRALWAYLGQVALGEYATANDVRSDVCHQVLSLYGEMWCLSDLIEAVDQGYAIRDNFADAFVEGYGCIDVESSRAPADERGLVSPWKQILRAPEKYTLLSDRIKQDARLEDIRARLENEG